MNKLRIGFFDSGVGGLYYLQSFKKFIEQKNIHLEYKSYYLADTAGFPYGEKQHDELIHRIITLNISFVNTHSLNILVIACNTASMIGVSKLRDSFEQQNISTQVIGVVPAIKPAVEFLAFESQNIQRNITKTYVMNTQASAESDYMKKFAFDISTHYKKVTSVDSKIFIVSSQALVSAIEEMLLHDDSAYEAFAIVRLSKIVEEILSLNAQAVVLGCTHFLHIKKQLFKLLPPEIKIFDSVDGINERILYLIKNVLEIKESSEVIPRKNPTQFYCTSLKNLSLYKKLSTRFQLDCKDVVTFQKNL